MFYRNLQLAVRRKNLPELGEGEHYWVDLIGTPVENQALSYLGIVKGVIDNGITPYLEIEGAERKYLIPIEPKFVQSMDPAVKIVVDWEVDWTA